MKQVCLFILMCSALVGFAQEPLSLKFTLSGKIDPLPEPAKVILHYKNGEERVKDTVNLTSGTFRFRGRLQKPVKATLSVLKQSDNPRMMMAMRVDGTLTGRDGIIVYLDAGNIHIEGKTLQTATIEGSNAHAGYLAMQKTFQPVYARLMALESAMKATADKKGEDYRLLSEKFKETFKELKPLEAAFVRSHLNSYVAWNVLADKTLITEPALYKSLYDLFSEKFRNTEDGRALLARINSAIATAIGQPAPLFVQDDPYGNPLSLASLKGKYVLIDFWASWCGPCRAENPNVVKAYNKFKDKNFEILGVSLDEKREAWLQAIEKDGLPWRHVSDLKGWNNEVAAQYNVQAVPQNLLLDPQGIIIAKNLRGDELEKTLEELIK